jgi:serine/threonine protein kinase
LSLDSIKCIKYLDLIMGKIIKAFRKDKPAIKASDIDKIKILKFLAEGNNGKVYIIKIDQNIYALKVISKFKVLNNDLLKNLKYEKYVMEHLDCNFLLRLEGYFQTERCIYFIMDYLTTDLYCVLHKYKRLDFKR